MRDVITKRLELVGVTPIMFDVFRGQETIPCEKKMYLNGKGGLILPSGNILGFLNSQKVHSCLRLYASSKEWQIRSNEIKGCVAILPNEIPFLDENDKPIVFKDWNERIFIDTRMTYPNKKVRQLTSRPVLNPPWRLQIEIRILLTDFISEERILDWFERGGFEVGICANRPLFGRFDAKVLS